MPQKMKRLCGLILAVGALTISPAAAQEKVPTKPQHVAATAKSAHAHRQRGDAARPIAPRRQIACTVVGCNPVPPGCHPEPQRYFSGMTTGYDAIVCP